MSTAQKPKSLYSVKPWEAHHQKDRTEIMAYVEASGKMETILTVYATSGMSHEVMASRLLALINTNLKNQNTISKAIEALELCLEEGLTFSLEKTIDSVLVDIKKQVG